MQGSELDEEDVRDVQSDDPLQRSICAGGRLVTGQSACSVKRGWRKVAEVAEGEGGQAIRR